MHTIFTHFLSITFLLSLFTFNTTFAQDRGEAGREPITVIGKITDDISGLPLEYATISLYSATDSSLITGGVTLPDGTFNLEKSQTGPFYAVISFIGYVEKTIEGARPDMSNRTIDLGTITISANTEALEEVEVVAERSQMQLQLDKRVFTVGKDLSNTGGTASDILENIPSVTVDVEGNVSLRGSQNVRILIDGKPSGLTGMSGTDALRLLQSDAIERVEIVTNPSARYDAEGEVGIINIILKKDKKKGFNASISANVGYPHNHGLGVNFNYRTGKVNFFGTYGINFRRNPGSGFIDQRSMEGDSTVYFRTDRDHFRGGLSNTVRLGTDLYIGEKRTLTFSGLGQYSEGHNEVDIVYTDLNAAGDVLGRSTRKEDEDEDQYTIEAQVDYKRTFKKKGHELAAGVKWFIEDDTEFADITEVPFNDPTILQRTSNEEDELNYLVQADYVHPVWNKGKFEIGTKGTFRNINNVYSVEQRDSSEWVLLDNFNDDFEYRENIYAAYAMLGSEIKFFSWQLGLRTEYTDIVTRSAVNNSEVEQDYIGFFPSAHFSFKINDENTFQISYSRRLSRPRFRWLLPFSSFSDSRNFWTGNPNLQPEYTNSGELGYLKYWKKGSLLTSIYYRYRTNMIERIATVNEDGLTISFPVNLATGHYTGLEMNLQQNLFKWWTITAGINIYYFTSKGSYEGQNLDASAITGNGRVSSKWELPKDIDIQASVRYNGPEQSSQGRNKSMTGVDLAIAKDVIQGKGTLTLSGRDLFNTRKRRSITDTEELYRENEFQWRSRQVVLTFNYRINQKKNDRSGGMMEGGGDEF